MKDLDVKFESVRLRVTCSGSPISEWGCERFHWHKTLQEWVSLYSLKYCDAGENLADVDLVWK